MTGQFAEEGRYRDVHADSMPTIHHPPLVEAPPIRSSLVNEAGSSGATEAAVGSATLIPDDEREAEHRLLCARLSCGHLAAASVQFDADGLRVMIVDLGDNTVGIPLCGHHTRTRTAPMGWTMVDDRTAPLQPALWHPDAPPPAALGPTARPPRRRPTDRAFRWGRDENVGEPDESITVDDAASTPLLARAFRSVN